MRPLPVRILRTLGAGVLGGLKWLLFLAIGVGVGVIVMRAGLQYYVSGSFSLFPAAASSSGSVADVPITGATPAEAAAIRRALGDLSYQLPARAVTFSVTDNPDCVQCGGDFQPALNLIQIERSLVDVGGAPLRHAVAHEIGHYVDQTYLLDSQRLEFMKLRRIPSNLSWLAENTAWQKRPVEDFAEVFAVLDLPTAEIPPETAYGPVRNPVAFRRLIESAGVRLGGQAPSSDWRSVAQQEFAFFEDMTTGPYMRLFWGLLVAVYVGVGAIPAMRDEWRR